MLRRMEVPQKSGACAGKIILVLAALAIVVSGLFPPWLYTIYATGTREEAGYRSEKSAGCHFLLTPPPPEIDHVACGVKLDAERLCIEWACILAAGTAAWGIAGLIRSRISETIPKTNIASTQLGDAATPDISDRSPITTQENERATETMTPTTPTPGTDDGEKALNPHEPYDSWTDYWYGNVYMMLCVYMAYCAVTHLIGAISRLQSDSPPDAAVVSGAVTTILLQTSALIFFGYVTYTLSQRRVKMAAIYTVAVLSGIGVLFGTPGFLLIWIILCPMSTFGFFRHKKAEELLKTAAQMERDGKVQEALVAYRKILDSRTAVARDARKAITSLGSTIQGVGKMQPVPSKPSQIAE